MADWKSIVQTHGPMAFQTGWRLLGNCDDAQECVQEALLDAFHLHSRQTIDNWGGLLRQLTTRRAIDRLRQRKPLEEISAEPLARTSDEPESMALERELAERLRLAVAALPDQQASVFALHCFAEMSRSEIAEALQISGNAVGVALHKARAKLAVSLKLKPEASTGATASGDLTKNASDIRRKGEA